MDTDNLIGMQFGDFLIRERIGRGGMASVYRAHQGSVGREVALKIIPLGRAGLIDETFQRRFAREAKLIASLEHIHILPVYDYGITEDAAYLAMRLLRGGTLADRLHDGPLDTETAAELFHQLASGLHYAHRKGVIHRDLKPSNILLDDSGNVLLADFGLAKLAGENVDATRSGTVVGTPAYMSPEQATGRPVDQRSDVYSAGLVLYEMLTGRPPFDGPHADVVAVLFRHIHEEPVALRR
ncbi:serine/threonine protein kinase, partial [bacterium]|nr:serine/threonine protein kinase [bacterium]